MRMKTDWKITERNCSYQARHLAIFHEHCYSHLWMRLWIHYFSKNLDLSHIYLYQLQCLSFVSFFQEIWLLIWQELYRVACKLVTEVIAWICSRTLSSSFVLVSLCIVIFIHYGCSPLWKWVVDLHSLLLLIGRTWLAHVFRDRYWNRWSQYIEDLQLEMFLFHKVSLLAQILKKCYSGLSMQTSLKSSKLVKYLKKVSDRKLKGWIVWTIRSPPVQASYFWSTSRHWIKQMSTISKASFHFCSLFSSRYFLTMFDLLGAKISG